MRDSYKRRVQRGIKLLNINIPDWLDRINLSELNMGSGCSCILGQLFRRNPTDTFAFCEAVDVLKIADDIEIQASYGFELSERFFAAAMREKANATSLYNEHSARLRSAWIDAIDKLRAKKNLK